MDAVLNSVAVLLALVIFDLLAIGWGVNSRDGRRETWW